MSRRVLLLAWLLFPAAAAAQTAEVTVRIH